MKLYLFKELNYYIGENLPMELKDKAVILKTEAVEGKTPKIVYDETGVSVEWVDESIEEGGI